MIAWAFGKCSAAAGHRVRVCIGFGWLSAMTKAPNISLFRPNEVSPPPGHCGPTRTTMAAGIFAFRGSELLMVRQHRASGIRWEIPCGGQEPGEPLEEVAAREAKEETGLSVTVGPLACTYICHRPVQGTIVVGAVYQSNIDDRDATPIPQTDDGILEAAFIDPLTLPLEEVGHLSALMIKQWWPQRHTPNPRPFHVELWRTPTGYAQHM